MGLHGVWSRHSTLFQRSALLIIWTSKACSKTSLRKQNHLFQKNVRGLHLLSTPSVSTISLRFKVSQDGLDRWG